MGVKAISTLKTLENALELLECFKKKDTWGVRELANDRGLSPTAIYRLIATLENNGYLIQDKKTKRYALGLKFLEFSVHLQNKLKFKELVFPYMEELAQETGETIFFTILDELRGLSIAIAESPQSIKFDVKVGTFKPLHAAASNLIILAFLPEDKQNQILNGRLEKFTAYTKTDPKELKVILEEIKEQGWSCTYSETTLDAIGIGVPIFDSDNKIIGSLNVAGPLYRIPEEKINEFLGLALKKRETIQQMIYSLGLTYSQIKKSIL